MKQKHDEKLGLKDSKLPGVLHARVIKYYYFQFMKNSKNVCVNVWTVL